MNANTRSQETMARWRVYVAILFLGIGWLCGSIAVWGEDYKATLGSREVIIPFPEGTKKQTDDPATHTSTYEFLLVDKNTMATKLKLHWVITSYEKDIPRDNVEAQKVIRALVKQTGLNIPEERIRVLALDDMNTDFLVYWAPYYHLTTGSEQAPFLIYKPTILVEKSGSLGVIMQVTGLLVFKEANPQDLKIAEDFMDNMLVSVVRNTALRRLSIPSNDRRPPTPEPL